GRTNHTDRLGDILWTKTAGQNDGRARSLNDLPADAPVMGDAKRPDLSVLRSVAVQQQVVCDSFVALSDFYALQARHRHTSHQQDIRNHALEPQHMLRCDE